MTPLAVPTTPPRGMLARPPKAPATAGGPWNVWRLLDTWEKANEPEYGSYISAWNSRQSNRRLLTFFPATAFRVSFRTKQPELGCKNSYVRDQATSSDIDSIPDIPRPA